MRWGLTPWRRHVEWNLALPKCRTYAFWAGLWQPHDVWLRGVETQLNEAGLLVERGGDFDHWEATVDAYIAGVEAQRELAFTAAGGEEAYGEMITWAEKHLTQAEIEAYDKAVTEGRPRDVAEAVRGLAERFRAEGSSEPDLLHGDAAATSVEGFRSKAELTAAMADPRYKTDSNFRKEVQEKISAAERQGINLFM